MASVTNAPRGQRTVYVRCGVWHDPETGRIHITVPGEPRAHWSLREGGDATGVTNDRQFRVFRSILKRQGRWAA